MIRIFCRDRHRDEERPGREGLCAGCQELLQYASFRLDRCPFGEEKPTCAQCAVHCYRSEMRERIQEVMRYSGPRMLLRHPLLLLGHLLDARRSRKRSLRRRPSDHCRAQ